MSAADTPVRFIYELLPKLLLIYVRAAYIKLGTIVRKVRYMFCMDVLKTNGAAFNLLKSLLVDLGVLKMWSLSPGVVSSDDYEELRHRRGGQKSWRYSR